MKYLAPIPKQFVDQNGLPLSDGKVHIYISGDTQYANVYQDADGNELMPNPSRLDSNGAWLGFVTAGIPLDYVVEDKDGNVQFEYEKVVAGSGTANVAIEPVLTSGTKIAECWVDGELLELFAPDGATVELPLRIVGGKITNNGASLTCTGTNAWAEGNSTKSTGQQSHAEGYSTEASANYAHAEGCYSKALQGSSHAEGFNAKANGVAAHAEGYDSEASGNDSHAEGKDTTASGQASHAEGRSTAASGNYSHASGYGTRATGEGSTAVGKYNDDGTALLVVGNGTANNARSDCFKVDSNGDTWVTIGGVLTKITSLGGGIGIPIYATLQDAITDQANLPVGTIFETNGFYTSGDGGAARYLVSSTGTANGMDIVSMGGGKLAILQVNANREMFPEQFGYKRDTNRNDLTPYLVRMTTMPNTPVRNIRLMPTGSSAAVYVMRTTWNITAASVSVRGHCELSSGHATQIWFLPDSYGAEYTPMFKFGQRGFDMKNLVLFNRPWFNDGDKHNCVCLYMALSNTNKMWYDFDSLAIQGFDIGVAKVPPTGELSDGLIWHCEFHRLSMSLNNKNIYIKGLSYVTKFDNCFLTVNDTGAESIVLEETFSTEFDRCNFGIFNPSTTILHCQDFLVSGKPVDVRWMQCKFTNCNFELETNDSHPLPENKSGFFIKCDDHDDFNLELDNCDFIQTPLSRNNIYTNRCIRLGARTRIILRQCCGPYADVNYTGNEFYGWDFQKRMFDGAHPPKKEVGSFKLEHCIGLIPPPNNQWGSAYLPTVMTDNMGCPLCDNNTKFPENYPTASDGIILANLDKANLEAKLGASMVQVTSPATGKIRIGDRIYDYVTIDGRKWITTNLQLWTMNTRQWHFPDHEEFGFYYGYETFPEVDALLPAGWRRPNYADCQSIVSQGYAAVQALGQSVFPNATNTTGLSILPCYKWFKPNTSVTFNRGFFWGPEEVGVGWHAVNVQPSYISYAGWNYTDSKTLKIPLRVCCDA